jgi:hypothetical protein
MIPEKDDLYGFYAAINKLSEQLAMAGEIEWANRLNDAHLAGLGSEILGELRRVLTELVASDAAQRPGQVTTIKALYDWVDDFLVPFFGRQGQ